MPESVQTLCFGWRKAKDGAILEQGSVHFASLAMQGRGNPAAEGLLVAGPVRGTVVDYALAGRDISDGRCIDQRNGACAQPTDRDRVARPDRKHDLSGEMRRELHFRAVGQDQAVDVASRGERVLSDRPSRFGKLRGIPHRARDLGSGGGTRSDRRRGEKRAYEHARPWGLHGESPSN